MKNCEHGNISLDAVCETCYDIEDTRRYNNAVSSGEHMENRKIVKLILDKAAEFFIEHKEDNAKILRKLAEDLKRK